MNKKRLLLVCLLLAAIMLFAACGGESNKGAANDPASNIDDNFVVAKVNGKPIYYSQYIRQLNVACEYFGISKDDKQNIGIVKDMILKQLVETEIATQVYTEKGYLNLTESQLDAVEKDVEDEMDSIIEYYYSEDLLDELGEGYSQEEYEAVKSKYAKKALEEYGYSKEDITNIFTMEIAKDAAWDDLVGSIVPTDQQVKQEYDNEVALAKEALADDPTYYEHLLSEGSPVYYVPEGVRLVRHILVKFDDEMMSAISSLKSDGFDKAKDLLRESALLQIKDKAQEILDKIESGSIDFAKAIEEYNEDPGLTEEGYSIVVTEKGLELTDKVNSEKISFAEAVDEYKKHNEENDITPSWVEEFALAAMSLKSKGEISSLVGTDFGYHIVEYFNDVASGAADFDSVKQSIYDSLLESLKQERWDEINKEWIAAAKVEYTEDEF